MKSPYMFSVVSSWFTSSALLHWFPNISALRYVDYFVIATRDTQYTHHIGVSVMPNNGSAEAWGKQVFDGMSFESHL
jgi:hypothetical protein